MEPMAAQSIDFTSLESYVTDDNWYFEQKLNGERLVLDIQDGVVTGINRKGTITPVDPRISAAFADFNGHWVLDGEYVDGVFWIFDLPVCVGYEEGTPYYFRRQILETIVTEVLEHLSRHIRLLPTRTTSKQKLDLMRWCIESNAEGIMLKDRDAPYVFGPERSPRMLKAKLVETVDCVVRLVGREGKRSIALSLYDENDNFVDVGSCMVTESMLTKLKVGDVVEVRYLYASQDRRLQQPVFLKIRADKTVESCKIDQLKIGNKTVQGEK